MLQMTLRLYLLFRDSIFRYLAVFGELLVELELSLHDKLRKVLIKDLRFFFFLQKHFSIVAIIYLLGLLLSDFCKMFILLQALT